MEAGDSELVDDDEVGRKSLYHSLAHCLSLLDDLVCSSKRHRVRNNAGCLMFPLIFECWRCSVRLFDKSVSKRPIEWINWQFSVAQRIAVGVMSRPAFWGLIANGAEIADCNWVSFSASDTHYVKFDAVTSSQTDRETNRPCHFDL